MSIQTKVINLFNRIIRRESWYRNIFTDSIKFWNNIPFNIDVVNLGSNSSKYAFSYAKLCIRGVNWALGPQSLAHDFSVLKNYFSFLKENGTVIISLCPFSCLVSNYNKQQNFKYYTFLHPTTIFNFEESERVKALKLKQNPVKYYPTLCLKKSIKELILFPKRLIRNLRLSKVDFSNHADSFIQMWMNQFGISDLNSPLSAKHLKEQEERTLLLSDMIDFCLERDLKPIIVIPPMHPALSSKFSEEFRRNYIYSFIEKANNQNITVLDYIDSPEFKEDKYFRNSFFMSDEGAKKFTKRVLSDCGILN